MDSVTCRSVTFRDLGEMRIGCHKFLFRIVVCYDDVLVYFHLRDPSLRAFPSGTSWSFECGRMVGPGVAVASGASEHRGLPRLRFSVIWKATRNQIQQRGASLFPVQITTNTCPLPRGFPRWATIIRKPSLFPPTTPSYGHDVRRRDNRGYTRTRSYPHC